MAHPFFRIEITYSLIAFCMESDKIHSGFFQSGTKGFRIEILPHIRTGFLGVIIKKHGIFGLIHTENFSCSVSRGSGDKKSLWKLSSTGLKEVAITS
jgi:hypothetical protein